MAKTVSAEVYLVFAPEIAGSGSHQYVRKMMLRKATVNKPSLLKDEVAFKVIANFDEAALIRSIPEVTINIDGFSTPLSGLFAESK